ncbi:VC0807 family protein [Teredinibacter purpureus]|uniref:VC0807 family protein n=1 Tax=Teredinibacter purpureus TaxID=2731756 RepID=UPI0005F7BA59|nr:VC0807 family protein [Teredinibacter purpureus]
MTNNSSEIPASSAPKKENAFLNIALNIVIPTVILMKFSGPDDLGPQLGVIVALAFPIGYGVMDYFRAKKINFFSALGVLSILLTGGITLLELDPKYIAIKEATIPALFGLATLISLKTRYPLVKTFLFNDNVMQTKKVHDALAKSANEPQFERCLINASYMIASSFALSSVLNYALAKWVLVSAPGTEEFNAELGKMTALSLPVITLPAMAVLIFALFYLFRQITKLTGLSLEEVFVDPEEHKKR